MSQNTKKYERIALSDRYNLCGVALWTMDLFRKVGYMRPVEYDESVWKKLIYHLRTLAFISTHFVALTIVEIAAVIMFWPDLPRVSGAAFILSANIAHGIKLITLIRNRNIFVSLVDFFVESLSKKNLADSKTLNIIISHEKMAFRDISIILIVTAVAVAGLAGVGDLMDPTGLPLVGYYSFEIHYTPMFQLVYVHQMVAVLIAAFMNVILDMFTNNMVIQLCCQFQLLKRDIGLIQEIPYTNDAEISRRLHELVDRQCVLKKRCSELSQACGVPVLGQFLGSIFIICISFYQFARAADTTLITIISMMSMMVWALLQAFFYCYYGNEIKIESQSVAMSLAELQWYQFNHKNKRTLQLMVQTSQRPIVLQAAGVISITMDALMSIMKTAYSFFSVMASIDTTEK